MCFKTVGLFSLINGLEKYLFYISLSFLAAFKEEKVTFGHKNRKYVQKLINVYTTLCCKCMCLHTRIYIILFRHSLSSRWLLPIGRHSRLF